MDFDINTISDELQRYREQFDPRSVFQNDTAPLSRIINLIEERIAGARGLSIIRLGDGEGACLFYQEKTFSTLRRYVLSKTLVLHFGNQKYTESDFEYFFSQMQVATNQADVITFARNPRVHAEIIGSKKAEARGYVGSTYANHYVSELRTRSAATVYHDGYLHVALLPHFDRILIGQDVFIVSCFSQHQNLRLAEKFGFNLCGAIEIPGQFVNDPYNFVKPLYPIFHLEVSDAIEQHARPGRVFLIAAGLLSKALCVQAAKGGSVALDVGSIMDVWHGKGVRPYQNSDFIQKYRV